MLPLAVAVLPFAVSMSITPGPNNFMLAASGANFGMKRSLPHIFGIVVGFPLMVVVIGLGLKPIFGELPMVHSALKIVGAVYLLYLAYRTATAAPASGDADSQARPLNFWEAAAFQWINPKAWVIAVGATTTYTTVGGELLTEASVIAATFAISSLPILLLWTAFGIGIARVLNKSARALRMFNVTMGLMLAISVVSLLA